MSKKFDRYKVNCSWVPSLMAREQGVNPPTEKQFSDFLSILQKDIKDITVPMQEKLQRFVIKTVEYNDYPISIGFKRSLYEQYAYAMYGVNRVSNTRFVPLRLEKGEVAEPAAIALLSKIDGVEYVKNEKIFTNKYFKGIPDIVLEENGQIIGVKDTKVSFDLPTFLERVDNDSLKDDRWQMMAYMDVLGLKEGEIVYCLVDMPEQIKELRLREHEERMIDIGISKEHIKNRLKQIRNSMEYDYIPDELKIKRFKVERKPWFIRQIRDRVRLVRKELYDLDLKFQKKDIFLTETDQLSQPPEDMF